MRIAIDAMGGDHAPAEIMKGVAEALAEGFEGRLLIVGRREAVEAAGLPADRVEFVHAEHVVGMNDAPTSRDDSSSVAVGVGLVRDGRADAFLSAGNTGAFMTQAVLHLKRLEGVTRPAIPTTIPLGTDRFAVLIDSGATADCKPEHLVEFAVMGSAYARLALGVERPRVGLLANGSERKKGNRLVKETGALLDALAAAGGIEFAGHVEGNALFEGRADVVVCDGFLGNVALKICEGMAMRVLHMVKSEFAAAGIPVEAGAKLLAAVGRRIDYMEYGGAPLLGVRGILVKSHGSSKARAIRNAIRRIVELHAADVTGAIERGLRAAAVVRPADRSTSN